MGEVTEIMEPTDYQLIQSEVHKNSNIQESDYEDFVQDVYLKLLETKTKYISRPYLRTLLKNMLIDRYRKEIRRPELVFDNKDYSDEHSDSRNDDSELAEEE